MVILDEPTAALGVAQTAEVLNLIERLRERGHGVVLISHNMADVQAVADRILVLRLGRNNGDFLVPDVSYEDIIAAITGATDTPAVRRIDPLPLEPERPLNPVRELPRWGRRQGPRRPRSGPDR